MAAYSRADWTTFRRELKDRLARIAGAVDQLDSAPGWAAPEAIHELFREFHSLKGAANLLGMEPLEQLAHRAEDVLALARDRGMPPGLPLSTFLSALVERMEELAVNPRLVRTLDISRDLARIDWFVQERWRAA